MHAGTLVAAAGKNWVPVLKVTWAEAHVWQTLALALKFQQYGYQHVRLVELYVVMYGW